VALAILEDLGSHPVGVDYEMTLSGAVGTTAAVADTVEMIMETVVVSFLVEVAVMVMVSFLVEVAVMVKAITKEEGEVAGQADQNRMLLFRTEVVDDFWEIVL